MPAEIKVSNFGIPFLDLANVSIRAPTFQFGRKKSLKSKSKSSKAQSTPPAPRRCPTCGNLSQHPPVPEKDDVYAVDAAGKRVRPGGLYIRFANQLEAPTQKISERRLAKLRWTIAEAVTKVGMVTPSSEEPSVTGDAQSTDGSETLQSTGSRKPTLFKGTYGQIQEALKNAGLATIPCSETGFENATRLGALFVSDSKSFGVHGVEFRKLTLWG